MMIMIMMSSVTNKLPQWNGLYRHANHNKKNMMYYYAISFTWIIAITIKCHYNCTFIVICYYNVWFAFIFTRHCIQNAVHLCTMSHCIMDGSQTQRDTPDTCVNLRLHKAARMKAALICFDKCLTGHFTKDKHINHCSVSYTRSAWHVSCCATCKTLSKIMSIIISLTKNEPWFYYSKSVVTMFLVDWLPFA